MKGFITFCLFVIPFVQGSVITETGTGTAPKATLAVLKSHRLLEKEIRSNYSKLSNDIHFPPCMEHTVNGVGPLHVQANAYIRQILEVKNVGGDVNEMTVDLTFRQKWTDKRLSYDISESPNYKYINLYGASGIKSIWKPDTFFPGTIKADFHFVLASNALVWVYPNGQVLYSIRVTTTVRCEVPEKTEDKEEEKKTLVCPLRVASYGYTDEELVYDWDAEEPIQLKKEYHIPHYTLDKVTTEGGSGKTKIGSFNTIIAKFHFTPKEKQ